MQIDQLSTNIKAAPPIVLEILVLVIARESEVLQEK